MKIDSVRSSAEDIEAIVRRVLAEVLSKQHSGSEERSHTSGERLNLEDFELPDDLGSMFTAVTLPNEIKDEAGKGGDGLNDADTADPDSLCDDAAEKIGDLEQKLALANAINEMFEEEIRRLKSIIENQSQDIERLNEGKKKNDKEQAHLVAAKNFGFYRMKYVTMLKANDKLEERLARQKKELATLNQKVKLGVFNKNAISLTPNKAYLMARIEREKQELARLNKQVENNKAKELELWESFAVHLNK